jgi:hypothetical protein
VGAPDLQRPDMAKGNELMADLVAVALQCDLVRVFTFRHHGWTDDPFFYELGGRDRHHNLTHNEGGDQPVVHKINVFTMQSLAVLLERLKRATIGGQPLLNHVGLMAYSEVGEGRNHARSDIPLIVAGRAGGALKPGVYHRSATRESATKVNLTLMRAVGMKVDAFGDGPNRVTDGVTALL